MTRKVSSNDRELAQLTDRFIYIIGPQRFQNGLIVFFLERKTGATCTATEDVRDLLTIDGRNISNPILILLDCLKKDLHTYLTELESSDENILDRHLVALFNVSPGLGIEEKALRKRVRGFFYEQDSLERFPKGVRAMFSGELWASRGVMTKAILELRDTGTVRKKDPTILTPREIEVLTMVAVGARNGEIANELFISTHTVKTHIYNIFRKINVPNRLQAAFWAAKNL